MYVQTLVTLNWTKYFIWNLLEFYKSYSRSETEGECISWCWL